MAGLKSFLVAAPIAAFCALGGELVCGAAAVAGVSLSSQPLLKSIDQQVTACSGGDSKACASIAGGAAGAVVGGLAGGVLGSAAEDAVQGGVIYRAGGSSPSNLKIRSGENALSFRDSLSNPIGAGERPVFRPGDQYIGVETSKLPPGSVIRDNAPPGHVSVKATPEQIKAAIVEKGKLPR